MMSGRSWLVGAVGRGAWVLLTAALASACATEDAEAPGATDGEAIDDPDPVVDWVTLECDPLAPAYCGFPFPSNVFTVADPSSPTGRRVQLAAGAMPVSYYDQAIDHTAWNHVDGFSTSGGIMVHLPGATSEGLPTVFDIDASMTADSPTILLDTETGQRVPHFAELDTSTDDAARATLFIRPAYALEHNRRYIVALAGVQGSSGEPLPASDAFAALRDGTALPEEPTLEARRPLYSDIFRRLGDLGVDRGQLQLAWDFTTSSNEYVTGQLVHMRDESFAMLGDAAPNWEITSVEDDFDPRVAYRILGTFDVPLYLDVPGPVSKMNFGPDGLPEPTGVAQFDFELLIPASATEQPAKLMQFGHGLLGLPTEIEAEYHLDFINEYGYAMYSSEWLGLAKPDEAFLGGILDSGRLEEFEGVFQRNQQAVLNALWLNRVMTRGIAQDETYGALLDPSRNHFYGISLGGILGTVYMAMTTDVTRGAVEVMGGPWNQLVGRSKNFDAFVGIATSTYEDPRDIQYAFGLLQLFWDRADPSGYARHIATQPLPNTQSHELLMRGARGDHQVGHSTQLYLARSVGAPQIDTGLETNYGMVSLAEAQGLGYAEYDFGLPADPPCNTPQRACENPHGSVRQLTDGFVQLARFFDTGVIANTCASGTCSYPELGGCPGAEQSGTCHP